MAVLLMATTAGAGDGRLSPEAIMELAREGRNREAIEAFEALPEADGPYPLHLLRAVAGSYWREREFESARELYNEILKRRPTLQGLVPGDEPVAPAVMDAPEVTEVLADSLAVDEAVAAVEEPAPVVTKEQKSIADTAPVEEKGIPAVVPVEAADGIAVVTDPEPDPAGGEVDVISAIADATGPAVDHPEVEAETPVAVADAAMMAPDEGAFPLCVLMSCWSSCAASMLRSKRVPGSVKSYCRSV